MDFFIVCRPQQYCAYKYFCILDEKDFMDLSGILKKKKKTERNPSFLPHSQKQAMLSHSWKFNSTEATRVRYLLTWSIYFSLYIYFLTTSVDKLEFLMSLNTLIYISFQSGLEIITANTLSVFLQFHEVERFVQYVLC